MHNVLLIDPATRTVKAIEVDLDIQTLYDLLDCELVETYPWDDEPYTMAITDEEGLFNNDREGFSLPSYTQPVVGKIIVAQVNEDTGEWCGFGNLAVRDALACNILRRAQWWTVEQVAAWKREHHIV